MMTRAEMADEVGREQTKAAQARLDLETARGMLALIDQSRALLARSVHRYQDRLECALGRLAKLRELMGEGSGEQQGGDWTGAGGAL